MVEEERKGTTQGPGVRQNLSEKVQTGSVQDRERFDRAGSSHRGSNIRGDNKERCVSNVAEDKEGCGRFLPLTVNLRPVRGPRATVKG